MKWKSAQHRQTRRQATEAERQMDSLRRNQQGILEINNIVAAIENTSGGLTSLLDILAKKGINGLGLADISKENSKTEKQREPAK